MRSEYDNNKKTTAKQVLERDNTSKNVAFAVKKKAGG